MSSPDHSQPDIASWIEGLGLGQYAQAFAENEITFEMLRDLTSEDLKELGVSAMGHRKRLLAEIASLAGNAGAPAESVPAASAPAESAPAAVPAVHTIVEAKIQTAPPPDPGAFDPHREVKFTAPPPSFTTPARVPPPSAPSLSRSPARTPPAASAPAAPAGGRSAPAPSRGFWATLLASKFLFISIVAHLVFGVGATYFIVQRIQAKRKVTFQGGPPSVNPSKRVLEHKVSMAQKKKTGGAPPQAKRIATTGLSKLSLPDMPSMPSATTVVPGMAAGMGGAGFGQGMGFGNGMGSGMGGGGGGGGGGMSFFGFRGAGGGLVGSFYDLKQTREKKPTDVTAANYTGIVRKWVDEGMKESALSTYFKAPNSLSTVQFMIPDMPADEAPKAFGVEKEVKPAQWLAVYHGKVQAPKEGTYHFVGAADDLLLVRVNGKLVLDASWMNTSGLQPEEILPHPYGHFPHRGYIKGEAVHFSGADWAEMEVVIGERPGGHFWGVLMVEQTGGGKDKELPLFRLGNVKLPKSDGPAFPACDLNGPLWRVQAAGGGSLLDALKR